MIIFPLNFFSTSSTLFITGVTVIFTLFLQPQLLTGGGPYEHISGTIAMYIIEKVNANQLYEASCVGLIFSVIGIPLVLGIKKILDLITPDVNYYKYYNDKNEEKMLSCLLSPQSVSSYRLFN